VFLAIFSANLLLTSVHSGAIPPLVVKARVLNNDSLMSITLVFPLGNGQIWLGNLPAVLQNIFVFLHSVVCYCLLTKSICSHSDIQKMIIFLTICLIETFSGNLVA